MEILNIAAGVTLGGILAGMFFLCAREADRHQDWSEVPFWNGIGFVIPPLFIALVVALSLGAEAPKSQQEAPTDYGPGQRVEIPHQEGPDPLGLLD